MKKTIIIFYVLMVLLSCNSFFIKDHIIGNYYLTATDIVEQSALSYQDNDNGSVFLTVVGETVYSVGYNNSYIFLKQYPNYPNKTITNYYIVKIQNNINYLQKNKYGPFTLEEFNNKCNELQIINIQYTINLSL